MIKINLKTIFFYLDMNNLYGDAMSQYLPYGGFKWVKNTNQIVNKISNKSDNSLHGFFLEVDLDHPKIYMITIKIIISTRENKNSR